MTASFCRPDPQNAAELGLRRNWALVVGATLGLAVGMPGLLFYSIGNFSHIFASNFGWSSAVTFSGISFVPVVLLVGGPGVGVLIDRYGTRRFVAASLILLGVSYATLFLSTGSVLQYFLSCFAVAAAGSGATFISFTRVISDAFSARRGLALGIVVAGSGLFAFFIKPFAAALISQIGWCATLAVIGLLPVLIGTPVVLLTFPRSDGDSPSRSLTSNAAVERPGIGGALKTRALWILMAAFAPAAFATAAPVPHLEDILRSLHVTTGTVAVSSLLGVTLILGRLAGGWLMDRLWARLIGTVSIAGGAVGWLILARGRGDFQTASTAIGLVGLAAGVEGSLMSFLTSKYLGLRHYGAVYGILFGVFSFVGGIGPGLIGLIHDHLGNYRGILYTFSGLLMFSSASLLYLGRYPLQADAAKLSR